MTEVYKYNLGSRARAQYISSQLSRIKRKNLRILDLGCGSGYFTKIMSKYGSVVGIDPEKEAIKIAKQSYPSLTFKAASGMKMPFKKNSFDVVVCTEVIEHIPDDEAFLKEIRKILSPGGFLILTTESLEGMFPITDTCHEAGTKYYVNYTDGYTKKELTRKLKVSSFEVLDVSYSLVLFSKLFMEITKQTYARVNPTHANQSDVYKVKKHPLFLVYKFFFPLVLLGNTIDRWLNKALKGSCIMTTSKLQDDRKTKKSI